MIFIAIPVGTIALIGLAVLFLMGRHIYQVKRLPIEEARREWQAAEHLQQIERERHEREVDLSEREMRLKEQRFQVQAYLATTRLQPTQYGYPFLLPTAPLAHEPVSFPHSFHRVIEEKQKESEAAQLQLMAPGVRQPQQRYLIDQLEVNGLQVSPGVRTSDGQPIILSIVDAVHFKLIGSSGFGKSCLAAAILDQAIRLNSPDMLQIALLDLEHKTSRLFEGSPNVGSFQVGRRTVPMVATSADEVALHLGYLKKELDRRALLSEYDLQCEALLLMYVEEMLSLQYEASDELIEQMLKDLSVLAIRGRKYGMFLLACAQTDYSTPELKTAQKQFRSRMAFAIDTTAARSAGFMSTDLIKYSFSHSQQGDGMFVLETPGVASLMLAPVFDVRQKVLALDRRSAPVQPVFSDAPAMVVESERTGAERALNNSEHTLQAKRTEVFRLRSAPLNWQKIAIIEKVWNVKRGGSAAWKQAEQEYNQIVESE
jgi:hypothetical protein